MSLQISTDHVSVPLHGGLLVLYTGLIFNKCLLPEKTGLSVF